MSSKGFDVFLSYRVAGDHDLVEKIYHDLKDEGINAFLDSKCLVDGEPWETGFLRALDKSIIFMPIITTNTFPTLPLAEKQDNVLLEYEAAIELQKNGRIKCIFPVLVGPKNPTNPKVYDSYFPSCSAKHSSFPDLIMTANKQKLAVYMKNDWNIAVTVETKDRTVADIFKQFHGTQSFPFEGTYDSCVKALSLRLKGILPQQLPKSEKMNRNGLENDDDDDDEKSESEEEVDEEEEADANADDGDECMHRFSGKKSALGDDGAVKVRVTRTRRYCGPMSIIVCLCCMFPCIYFCPLDIETKWQEVVPV